MVRPRRWPPGKVLFGWGLLLLGLALACVNLPLQGKTPTSMPPEALTVTALAQELAQRQTQAAAWTPAAATPLVPPTAPSAPTLAPPAWPTILPTQVPAWSRATPTPAPASGPAPSLPPGGIAAEIWDYPSAKDVEGKPGPYAPRGGDVYDSNLYERPFRERTQDTFFPDLDIQYVRLMRQGEWYFAQIRLAGLMPGASAPTGQYGLEIDVDVDGRGDFLIWVQGPLSQQWQPRGASVYQDVRKDVEGPRVCTSDAPLRGDGYDNKVFETSPSAPLMWVRWGQETVGGKTYPVVYVIFHSRLVPDDDGKFLWQAWADGKLGQPGQMTYHDTYTLPQAGVPYPGDPNYPIKDLARMDSTCRATFGFRATGAEPCLCRTEATALICPQPSTPPLPTCTTGPGPYWTCTDPQQGNQTLYCTWDAELCRWDCRQEQLCPAPEAASLPDWFRVLPGASVDPNNTVIGATTTQPTPLDFGTFYRVQTGSQGPFTPLQQNCKWDARLCRFVCREEEKQCTVIPEAPYPGCEYLGNETWRCSSEIGATVYRWDKAFCRWDVIPSGEQCIPPETPPMNGCTQTEDGAWECTQAGEISTTFTCTWDTTLCDWNCSSVCQPDNTCVFQENQEIWVCPGRGKFENCRWDETQCRWRCWDPVGTSGGGDDEPVCQSETYCSQDGDLWYCADGGVYSTCTYDGCQWTCQ